MMLCRNCGAEYEDYLYKCPYCEAENIEATHKKQRDYVNKYRNKGNFFAMLPNLLVQRTGSAMKSAAKMIGVVFVVLLIVGGIGSYVYSSTAVTRMEKRVEKLENYYQAGDYEGLKEYYYSLDGAYGGNYEKYSRTVDAYYRVNSKIQMLKDWNDVSYITLFSIEEIERGFGGLILLITDLREMEASGYPYGEGEAVSKFKMELDKAIEQYLPMSEEEIDAAIERMRKDWNCDLTEEASLLYERLIGDTQDEMH